MCLGNVSVSPDCTFGLSVWAEIRRSAESQPLPGWAGAHSPADNLSHCAAFAVKMRSAVPACSLGITHFISRNKSRWRKAISFSFIQVGKCQEGHVEPGPAQACTKPWAEFNVGGHFCFFGLIQILTHFVQEIWCHFRHTQEGKKKTSP